MGMYSTFISETVKVIDLKGLRIFFDEFIKQFPNSIPAMEEVKMFKENKNRFTFEDWNEMKLISYWYPQDVLFLELVAPYIEGEVYWEYENNDEAGWVEFKDGECIFHIGHMEYAKYKWKAMVCGETVEIPEELLKMRNNALLLRKIEEGEKK